MHIQVQQLYASPTVTVRDCQCRAHRHGWGAEETSTTHQLVFMRAGVFAWRLGRTEVVADANHALFFNQHEAYRVAHPADCGDDCTVFDFAPGLVQEVVAACQPRREETPERPFEFTHALSSQPLHLLYQRLRQRLRAGANDPLTTDELALDLLATAVHQAYRSRGVAPPRKRRDTAEAHRQLVVATQLVLAQGFAEKLGLPELARRVHSSPFHLARLFRAKTGLAIHQYRQRLRLRIALDRVAAGEDDLTQLALELGFSSHSHLSDAFKSAFGLPPSECRRRATGRWLRQMSTNLEVGEGLVA